VCLLRGEERKTRLVQLCVPSVDVSDPKVHGWARAIDAVGLRFVGRGMRFGQDNLHFTRTEASASRVTALTPREENLPAKTVSVEGERSVVGRRLNEYMVKPVRAHGGSALANE